MTTDGNLWQLLATYGNFWLQLQPTEQGTGSEEEDEEEDDPQQEDEVEELEWVL